MLNYISVFVFLSVFSFCFSRDSFFDTNNIGRRYKTEKPSSFGRNIRSHHDPFQCEENRLSPRMDFTERIVGGSLISEQQTVPYIAAIGHRRKNDIFWFCGGSLITEALVLTAAHCLASRSADVVRLGGTHLDERAASQDVAVSSSVVHPEYKHPMSYYDLAILRLATDVTMTSGVKPICIVEGFSGRSPGETTYVMGWGAKEQGGNGSKRLRKAKVLIFETSECDKVYRNSSIGPTNFPHGIKSDQLCAGTPEGGRDACQGDSGGPLVVEENGAVRVLGIVSAGLGCGLKMYPGVYTRVSSHQNWIQSFMNNPEKVLEDGSSSNRRTSHTTERSRMDYSSDELYTRGTTEKTREHLNSEWGSIRTTERTIGHHNSNTNEWGTIRTTKKTGEHYSTNEWENARTTERTIGHQNPNEWGTVRTTERTIGHHNPNEWGTIRSTERTIGHHNPNEWGTIRSTERTIGHHNPNEWDNERTTERVIGHYNSNEWGTIRTTEQTREHYNPHGWESNPTVENGRDDYNGIVWRQMTTTENGRDHDFELGEKTTERSKTLFKNWFGK